jgi:hypothetical protein
MCLRLSWEAEPINRAVAANQRQGFAIFASFRSVLKLERRVSHEGMVSVGGNLYSVPDATRKRIVEVHTLANEVQIAELLVEAMFGGHARIDRAADRLD